MTTPNITGEPSKDKLKFICNTHMVIIEVGIEKEHFVVHQSFLCAKSQYFTKALSGSFQEAVTRFIPLPDVSPILFRIFVAWIYHGKLAYIPPDDRTIDEDFDSLKITEKDCEKEPDLQSERQNKLNNNQSDSGDSDDDVTGPSTGAPMPEASDHDASSSSGSSERSSPTSTVQYEGDDATTWSCDVLIKLYVFSDRFDVRELRADTLDALIISCKSLHGIQAQRYIHHTWMNTSIKSKLREYVVHHIAYTWAFDQPASVYETLPAEFLAAVMVTNSRRLPSKLCSLCHKKATKPFKDLPKDMCKKKDVAPFDTDLCFYHEHPDEEERKACRLRRAK
ncbi:hypothetical protein KCU99_g6245, partial [Aureobasidium melanogenum]